MRLRDVIKNIFGILLILCGICGMIMIYLVTSSRMDAPANSYNMMLTADVMIFVYSLINFICGIVTLARRSPRKIVRVRPFVQVGVILAIIQIIISASNGIVISHLIALAACGAVIPEVFILVITLVMQKK